MTAIAPAGRKATFMAALLIVSSCAPPQRTAEGLPLVQSRYDAPTSLAPSLTPSTAPPVAAVQPTIIGRGTGVFMRTRPEQSDIEPSGGGSFTLNFVNADLNNVLQTVLGEQLHLNYTVDPAVQATITLRSDVPVSQSALLPALERSLRDAGLALVSAGGAYHVVKLSDALRDTSGRLDAGEHLSTPGYGTDVISLHYATATDMLRLIAPFLPDAGQVKADNARNLLFVSGTSQERAAIRANVALFDVDYMAGMSFALVPLEEASATTVVNELQTIVTPKGGPLDGIVRFVPLEKMHSVLVLSSQPRYITDARRWVARLDHAETGDTPQVFVYQVQNGRAQDLSAALGKLLGGGGSDNDKHASGQGPGAPDSASTSFAAGLTGGSSIALPAGSPLSGDLQAGSPSGGDEIGTGLRISADEVNNAVLVLCTATQYQSILRTLRQLDVLPLQVLLEAVIAEVTLTKALSYGVQYAFQDSHNQFINTIGSAAIAPLLPGVAYTFANQNIKVILDALSGITKVNVISAPKLLVLNNQSASLDVGDDVPTTTQTAQSTVASGAPIVNSIQYRETGVLLRVTPRVNEGGEVQLDVSQEVSEVSPTTSSTLNSPTFTERKINSTVSVQDGETIALGGLIKDSRSSGTSGIPYLQQIPILGALFSHKDDNATRTELLVLITPHVVQSVDSLRNVTADLRRHMGQVEALLER
jgi:general secretion pathway protein D